MPKTSDDLDLTCQCPISYHLIDMPNGDKRAVLDGELPDIMVMCFGRCERCGRPYHTEFSATEPE